MIRRQWEGEVEFGGHGVRVGGGDLNLNEILEAGAHVRVTIEWPEVGEPHYRILAPSMGSLPPRPKAEGTGTVRQDVAA